MNKAVDDVVLLAWAGGFCIGAFCGVLFTVALLIVTTQ